MDDYEQAGPSDPTRRAFLRTMGRTAAAAVIVGCAPERPGASGPAAAIAAGSNIQGAVPITLRVGDRVSQANLTIAIQ